MSQRKVLNLPIHVNKSPIHLVTRPFKTEEKTYKVIENSVLFFTADLVVRAWNEANTAIFFFGFGEGNPCSGQLFMWT